MEKVIGFKATCSLTDHQKRRRYWKWIWHHFSSPMSQGDGGIHERSPVRNAQASSRTVLRKGYWGNKRFLSFRKGSSDIRKARSSFTEKRTFLPVLLAKWNKNESYLKKTQKLTETTSYVNETKNVHFSLCPKYLFWPCLVPDKYSMKKTKTNAKS